MFDGISKNIQQIYELLIIVLSCAVNKKYRSWHIHFYSILADPSLQLKMFHMKELEDTSYCQVTATPTPSPLVRQSQTSVEESSVPSPPVNCQKEESIVPTVTSIEFLQNSG